MFGENFPYTNFHDLNMDWIIKIAKDFLDQYTSIQQTISDGETSLQNLTTSGLEQLQEKADNLETLLQEWYNTHSADIANQLASALEDLNEWYTLHENYLDNTLAENITAFDRHAEEKAEETIESIPDDYTELSNTVDGIINGTSFPGVVGNIFGLCEIVDNAYPGDSGGSIVYNPMPDYKTIIIPIGANLPCYMSYVRFYAFLESDKETIIGGTVTDITANIPFATYTPDNCAYIVAGFSKTGAPSNDEYIVTIARDEIAKTAYIPDWLQYVFNPGKTIKKSTMTNGETLITGEIGQPRKGLAITFSANISTFTKLAVGLTISKYNAGTGYQINRVEIDDTNIVMFYNGERLNPITQTIAHGLTIENNIQVILTTDEKATLNVTLISNGYSKTVQALYTYAQMQSGCAFAMSTSSTLTDCVLGWALKDINKGIWYFGDSYTAFADDRWSRYASEWIDNILLDGYGGETSVYGIDAFTNYLSCGIPKYAIWALGMNDPADVGTTPNADWLIRAKIFIATCLHYKITPVLATIPSVPGKNNEGKNTFIRNSGYRYIDFAKAVDPNGTGSWYTGMLSSDNIHPTINGAKALYGRMVADFPEFYITK